MPLDRPVAEILREQCRTWTPHPPANDLEVTSLRTLAAFELPVEYVELLRYCDGGYGELNAAPLLFQMDSIAESVEHNQFWRRSGLFSQFWFIGGNGGLESIAFDLRAGPPFPLVMIDCIAGDDCAEQIACDMADFIQMIGLAEDRPK